MVKLLVVLVAWGSIGAATYTAVKPPAVTTDARAVQSVKHAAHAQRLREQARRNAMTRGLDAERRRHLQPRELRRAQPNRSLLGRLLARLPKPGLRLR